MLTQKDIQNRLEAIEQFIDSGEYKKYKNWKQNPFNIEYYWLRNGLGKPYLTDELKLKLDTISYFEYMCNSRCPYQTKPNHKWCRKCKVEQNLTDFRSAYICKQCAIQYRRDKYYEAGRIQSRINYHTKPEEKLHTLIRVYVNGAMKGNKKTKRSKEILGLEFEDFRSYIESMWEHWMNWDNYGHGEGKWVIQHIIPKVFAKTEQDIYRLNYYKNLMPWGFSENSKLKNKILVNQLNDWHYENCLDFIKDNEGTMCVEMDTYQDENGELELDVEFFLEHEKKLGRNWKKS